MTSIKEYKKMWMKWCVVWWIEAGSDKQAGRQMWNISRCTEIWTHVRAGDDISLQETGRADRCAE